MYEKIPNGAVDGEEVLVRGYDAARTISRRLERLFWLLVVTVLVVCNVFLIFPGIPKEASSIPTDTYETGFATDMGNCSSQK